jgi:Ca-activated chloride channel homolog
MKSKTPLKIAIQAAALLLLLPCAPMFAQAPQQGASTPPPPANPAAQSPQAAGPQAKITVNATTVVLPVTVKDRSGRLVPDIRKDEFRVFEDDVEQSITSFKVEAFPLSLVVLVDNDLKQRDADQVEESLRAVVAGMSIYDEAFVCRFDQFFHEGKGFTANQEKLVTELKRTRLDSQTAAPPQGGPFNGPSINGQPAPGAPNIPESTRVIKGQTTKALDDAIYAAAQLLKDRGRERRKMILLISDGQNNPKYNTNTYKTAVRELLRYGISVYSVAAGNAYFDRKFSRLVDYAHDSGGDVYFAAKRGTFEELYSRVTEEARNQYTLEYTPRGTDRGREHHSIEVRVQREGVSILTREGYFAGALPSAPSK